MLALPVVPKRSFSLDGVLFAHSCFILVMEEAKTSFSWTLGTLKEQQLRLSLGHVQFASFNSRFHRKLSRRSLEMLWSTNVGEFFWQRVIQNELRLQRKVSMTWSNKRPKANITSNHFWKGKLVAGSFVGVCHPCPRLSLNALDSCYLSVVDWWQFQGSREVKGLPNVREILQGWKHRTERSFACLRLANT